MSFSQMLAREEFVETQVKSWFQGQKSLEAAPWFFFFQDVKNLIREEVAEVQGKSGFQRHGSLEAAPLFFLFNA